MTPIMFIGGTGRCGTTMLLKVLALHPELFVLPNETDPHPFHVEQWRTKHYAPANSAALQLGAKWVVEKTPHNALYAQRFVTHYFKDKSRYLHMVRSPRMTVKSLMTRGRYVYPGAGVIGDADEARAYCDWMEAHGTATVRSLGKDAAILSFDELLYFPGHELARLCAWLEIGPPTEQMLDFPFDKTKGDFSELERIKRKWEGIRV